MPLITPELSVWDISFRWAGLDPSNYYFSYPLGVKDNFKLLMEAILHGELFCFQLLLDKRRHDSKADSKYFIRTHLDDVYACIHGHHYKRSLMKWATVERGDFKEWCERRGIPLPEFWFPKGWKDAFEWPEYDTRAFRAHYQEPDEPGLFSVHFDIPDYEGDEEQDGSEEELVGNKQLSHSKIVKLCAQQIASQIWKEEKDITISSMARDERVLKYSGAVRDHETMRKWMREVAPTWVKDKPGRPKNGK